MHLLNRYALSCGVKIDKPFINESYFPLTFDKYIVFQTSGKGNSRQYDYWSKVFSFIREYSKEYKIVHIGVGSDQSVPEVDLDLRGKTSISQLAYLIKNSSLYLGIDSLSAHLAGFYDRKMTVLYSYCYAQNCHPVWGKAENKTLLEVDWEVNGKPSFSIDEAQKKINTIFPENIAKSALDHLGVKNNLDKVKTLFIGKNYHTPTIEIVPDHVPPQAALLKDKMCNVRMDYFFDEKNLINISSICGKLNIITKKEINIDLLKTLKNKITGLTFIVSESTNPKYIEELKNIGFEISVVAPDDSKWNKLAEKFFDFCLEKDEIFSKKDIKNIDKIDKKCSFTSEKVIFSNGKIYSDKYSWKKDKPKMHSLLPVVDDPMFWEEAEHFHIIKDERTN